MNNTTQINEDYSTQLSKEQLFEQNEKLKQRIAELEKQVSDLSPQAKYKTPQYKYKNEEVLNPPAYQPSELEITLAKAKYAVEEEIWSIVHSLEQYISQLKGKEPQYPYTKDIIVNEGEKALRQWQEGMNKWNDENHMWEAFIDHKWFEDVYINGLSDMHVGDCTAFPASCMRCHAEAMFNIPSSISWGGKAAGYKLLKEYDADFDQKNPKKDKPKI